MDEAELAEKELHEPRKKSPIEEEVWQEDDILNLLGVNSGMLRALRDELQFPYVRLRKTRRVYLASSVLAWLKKREENRP